VGETAAGARSYSYDSRTLLPTLRSTLALATLLVLALRPCWTRLASHQAEAARHAAPSGYGLRGSGRWRDKGP
jgi:hypothetical protein